MWNIAQVESGQIRMFADFFVRSCQVVVGNPDIQVMDVVVSYVSREPVTKAAETKK